MTCQPLPVHLLTILCPSPRGLEPPPSRLSLFPSAFDGGFLIGPSVPQLLEDTIFHHLTLQRLDGIFDAIILNFDFQGLLPLLPEQAYLFLSLLPANLPPFFA